MGSEGLIKEALAEATSLHQSLESLTLRIAAAADLLAAAYLAGRKAIFFGNGGSASDAQHMAAELVGRFHVDRRPLPALALNANSSSITAIGNDFGYEQVFARQLRAFAQPGDVAIAISTSGSSKNVLEAVKLRDVLEIKVVALTGQNGAILAPHADEVIAVPSRNTPRIQEAHILIGHILCEWVERAVIGRSYA